jgi:hypothetical protein
MRRLAFLYLVLTAGTIVLAQQPTEWRPNIAEENKAATWEDTASFLSTTLMFQAEYRPARVDLEQRCHLQVVYATPARVAIGLQFQPTLDPAVAKEVKFKHGVVIATVAQGGPAASAGLKPKDVILGFDHHNIGTGDDLVHRVSGKHSGDNVDVEYMRDGKTLNTSMILRMREDFSLNVWDFTEVDPLTISVAMSKTSAVINFKGRNNGPAGQQIVGARIVDSEVQEKDRRSVGQCSTAESDCSQEQQPLLDAQSISFNDLEISKRFARALMHAALLCGGAKAVSPF